MPRHTPEQIIAVVDALEMERRVLQLRMDADFDRYNLVPYQGELNAKGEPVLAGYKKFTANDPRTSMNLAMYLLSTAKLVITVHQPRAQQTQREIDNFKELFCIGALRAADDLRADRLEPSLRDALAGQTLMRGRWAQRVLLEKEEAEGSDLSDVEESKGTTFSLPPQLPTTRTYVSITDWDPRNTYWAVGKHGLAWACHKSFKSAAEIKAEYKMDVGPVGASGLPWLPASGPSMNGGPDKSGGQGMLAVYDFCDETENTVIVEGAQELKKRTRHGMRRVPVSLGFVGGLPLFQSEGQDYQAYYGESFYQSDREMFDQQNFILSVLAELCQRSIMQGLLVYSADGTLTLEADPRVAGSEVSLSTARGEDIKPLPPMELIKETGSFIGIISQMVQRGSFPASVFGQIAFQLSGYAITQLRQGIEAPIGPALKALKTAHRQILNILADAYSSGAFDTMTLSGRAQDTNHTYFQQEIPPELVHQGGAIEVDLVAQLPQDDLSKATLAQMLREGPTPIADDRFIRETILAIQDSQQMEQAVWEQQAGRGSPLAIAFKAMLSAAQQGDMELAKIWELEFQSLTMQKMIEMTQLQALGGGPDKSGLGGGNGAAPGTPSPAVLPAPARGVPPATPTPQAGANTAPGTPRPNRPGPGGGIRQGFEIP